VDHQAGIRPAISDRRPIIGQHAEQKRAYIFNGLGARGGMVAPYFVMHFTDYLLDGKPLNKEVDIGRFS
jgi:glycine/D-amino acid oxidase-like deaminating enzyme